MRFVIGKSTGSGDRLEIADGYHLIELQAPLELADRYLATLRVKAAFESGAIASRSRQALQAWVDASLEHELDYMSVLKFLEGHLLTEADEYFDQKYILSLDNPRAWAAIAWLQETGGVLDVLDPSDPVEARCRRVVERLSGQGYVSRAGFPFRGDSPVQQG